MNHFLLYLASNKKIPFVYRRRKLFHKILKSKGWQYDVPSQIPLELVVPCIERDLNVAQLSIGSVRKFLLHPIEKISIVGPNQNSIKRFCEQNDCEFIDESSVLPISLNDIERYVVNSKDRRGWIFQQLLKLGASSFVNTQYYYVLDADTILLSPQSLFVEGKMVLNTSDEFHEPYRDVYELLLGEEAISPVSFVAHQMLFEKTILEDLKEKVEKTTLMPWYCAILKLIDRSNNSSFSEYELYGNFLVRYYASQVFLEYFSNISVPRVEDSSKISELMISLKDKYKSCSLHAYNISNC